MQAGQSMSRPLGGATGLFSVSSVIRLKPLPVQMVTTEKVPLSTAIAARISAVSNDWRASTMAANRVTGR